MQWDNEEERGQLPTLPWWDAGGKEGFPGITGPEFQIGSDIGSEERD